MTVIGINGSPRSNWNTSQLLRKALEGAESNGLQTELINLGELNFKPCSSCLVCKKCPENEGHCFQKDDLIPVFEKIKNAKAIIFGSPIYNRNVSALFHSFSERLLFSNISYRSLSFVSDKKIKTGMIFNMGSTLEQAVGSGYYDPIYARVQGEFAAMFGSCELLKVYDTMEVNDYSKYEMPIYDINHKLQIKRDQFPQDLNNAFELGKKISAQ